MDLLPHLRLVIALWGGAATVFGQPSPELTEALRNFRTEGPKGWAFTQISESSDRARVEAFDPLKPAHLRWDLITENGVPPSEQTTETYRQQQTRRTGGQTAPNVKEQLDLTTAELVDERNGRQTWRFKLTPGAEDDRSAAHMDATITFHVDSRTIEIIELANFEPFSPMFGVHVERARTVIEYSLPTTGMPSLLRHIAVSIRGRAFYFKSLDSDMTVAYSDYKYAGKAPLFPEPL